MHVYQYPLKLALASLTVGDRSIGIVRWLIKSTEFYYFFMHVYQITWRSKRLDSLLNVF
jgi:hypothetical protein